MANHSGRAAAGREPRLVVVSAHPDQLADLDVKYCRYCAYWETTGTYPRAEPRSILEHRKRDCYRQQGVGGKIAYLANQAVGYAQYGPAAAFPPERGSVGHSSKRWKPKRHTPAVRRSRHSPGAGHPTTPLGRSGSI